MPHLPSALEEVLLHQPVWRGNALAQSVPQAVPTGFAMLDQELPGGGWPDGALAEILYAREGIGEIQLVLPALAALSAAGHRIAWIAPPHLPYAPALAAAGLRPSCLTVVRVLARPDALWAAEQSLRAGACRAVLVWLRGARYADVRRLVLAAENNRGVGIVFRPTEESAEPSPACLRLALAPEAGKVSARILKRRGAPVATPLRIPIRRPVHAVDGALFPAPVARNPVARPYIV